MTKPTTTRVFVYGTLLSGHRNHRLLEGAKLVGKARTHPRFTLVSMGHFPAMVAEGTTVVSGEVYEVNDERLKALDHLEGYPDFYDRRTIYLHDATQALAYLLNRDQVHGRQEIPTGNWALYVEEQRR